MKVYVVLLVVLAVASIEAHWKKPNRPLEMPRCLQAKLDAEAAGQVIPQCTGKGMFLNKQCDNQICWCVSKQLGKPIFDGQIVPLNHRYDCKRRPNTCLKEELHIMMTEINPIWLPKCDCKGHYEEAQCKLVASDQCPPADAPGNNREKRRSKSCIEGTSTVIGFDPIKRSSLDVAPVWSMVSKARFTSDGVVRTFEVYVGATGRALCVGHYKPVGMGECEFKLVRQKIFDSLPIGYQQITLSGSDVWNVKAGDTYGFTWLQHGVVEYTKVSDKQPLAYCDVNESFEEGDTAHLNNAYGNRAYSIRIHVIECTNTDFEIPCDGPESTLGYDPIVRSNLDPVRNYTFVSKDGFTSDGQVRSFEMYVGGTTRALRVGIYRPIPAKGAHSGHTHGSHGAQSEDCKFQLVQQNEWNGFEEGLVTVELTGSDIFDVKSGDHYGFSWLNKGVITHGPSDVQNYCEDAALFTTGSVAQLKNRYGNRFYSIRMILTDCETPKPTTTATPIPTTTPTTTPIPTTTPTTPTPKITPPPIMCDQCYCVDPEDGEEVPNTRTFGTPDCE